MVRWKMEVESICGSPTFVWPSMAETFLFVWPLLGGGFCLFVGIGEFFWPKLQIFIFYFLKLKLQVTRK